MPCSSLPSTIRKPPPAAQLASKSCPEAWTCTHLSLCFSRRPAAYWGLASAVSATLALLLFLYLYAFRPDTKPPSTAVLFASGLLSAAGVAAGIGGFAAYLGLGIINTLHGDGIYNKKTKDAGFLYSFFLSADRPLFQTEYIVCVWTFMTFKWSITSYYYSIKTYKIIKPYD